MFEGQDRADCVAQNNLKAKLSKSNRVTRLLSLAGIVTEQTLCPPDPALANDAGVSHTGDELGSPIKRNSSSLVHLEHCESSTLPVEPVLFH